MVKILIMKLLGSCLCLQSLNIKLITFASEFDWINNSLFLDNFIHLAKSNNLSRFIRLNTIFGQILILLIIVWFSFKDYWNLLFKRFLNLLFHFIKFFLFILIFLCTGHNIFWLWTFLVILIYIVFLDYFR